ncbi:MAG TPA: AMP-binding protein [Kofleriaceae bacterium]|nr:AMP-binding protein [Kofleriaceae bacterium]
MSEVENLAGWVCAAVSGRGDKIVLREGERAWTGDQLCDQTARVATALRMLRIGRGERVAVLMRDSLDAASAILGTIYAGAVCVPLSELSRPSDIRDCINDSGAVAVIASAQLEPALDEARTETPGVREVLVAGRRGPGERDFHSLLRGTAPAAGPTPVEADAPAFILYSAGARDRLPSRFAATEGAQLGGLVGIPHTHAGPQKALAGPWQALLGLSGDDRVLSLLRLSTAYGLCAGLFYPLVAGAESLLFSEQPHTDAVLAAIADFDPTVLCATPSVLGQLARDVEADARPLENLRLCLAGGEEMPPKVVAEVEALGAGVTVGYGFTEALALIIAGPGADSGHGSCGAPLPGVSARVVGDSGAKLGPGDIGTLEVKAEFLASRYWGEAADEGTASGEWFRTRDRFMIDGDGNYVHCGRGDELFKVGGKWVAPAEVERAMLAHEAVWECAVIGAADDEGLLKPLAFVVPNIGQTPDDALEASLRSYVKDVLAPYKYPRWIEFVDALPRGPGGKVLRYKLRPPKSLP